MLSQGLDAKLIATSEHPVLLHDGSWSRRRFHHRPDGAATFKTGDDGSFVYVSNSKHAEPGKRGVGAMYFDKDANLLKYDMLLTDTTMNCGGGRTPWGMWVSNEEHGLSQIWQVDPLGRRPPEITQVGRDVGVWESFAYDVRDPARPRFFVTEDVYNGALARYTPSSGDIDGGGWGLLHDPQGTIEYLVLVRDGTFYWTPNRD